MGPIRGLGVVVGVFHRHPGPERGYGRFHIAPGKLQLTAQAMGCQGQDFCGCSRPGPITVSGIATGQGLDGGQFCFSSRHFTFGNQGTATDIGENPVQIGCALLRRLQGQNGIPFTKDFQHQPGGDTALLGSTHGGRHRTDGIGHLPRRLAGQLIVALHGGRKTNEIQCMPCVHPVGQIVGAVCGQRAVAPDNGKFLVHRQ